MPFLPQRQNEKIHMAHDKQIWYLIKFFTQKEHAEQFMDGDIYMNRLSFFKKIEDAGDDGRADQYEAISHWWQPDDLIIKLNIPGVGETEITKKDLAAPVTMALQAHDDLHVFCMYAMWTDGFECIDGKIDYAQEDAEKLRKQLIIDERCFKFGEHAVIVPAVQFIEKTKIALKETKKKSRMKIVDYFDGKKFHGAVDEVGIPFNKLNEYSYQNEFRICIDSQTRGDDPFTLRIGGIREFSARVKSSELNGLFKIDSIEI